MNTVHILTIHGIMDVQIIIITETTTMAMAMVISDYSYEYHFLDWATLISLIKQIVVVYIFDHFFFFPILKLRKACLRACVYACVCVCFKCQLNVLLIIPLGQHYIQVSLLFGLLTNPLLQTSTLTILLVPQGRMTHVSICLLQPFYVLL